ncbi:MAG: glutathione S-transferase family protein [Candidatus Binatia bacterium]
MLELYHHDLSVCAQKVRLCLEEKELKWESRYVDLGKREQKKPEYLRLNPNGNVPTLVHDGTVVYESTIVNEYLDDAFPEKPLRPVDALGKARVRKWTIQLDVSIHMAMRTLNTSIATRHRDMGNYTQEQIEVKLGTIADPAKRERKMTSFRQGIESPYVLESLQRYGKLIKEMESELADGRPWLVGEQFTLADVGFASYFTMMEALQIGWLWEKSPRFCGWFQRLKARPAYERAITRWLNSSKELPQRIKSGKECRDRLIQIFNAAV